MQPGVLVIQTQLTKQNQTKANPMQERRALKERQRAIEEAEESRRRRVTVTVDLLGRQVGYTHKRSFTSTCMHLGEPGMAGCSG